MSITSVGVWIRWVLNYNCVVTGIAGLLIVIGCIPKEKNHFPTESLGIGLNTAVEQPGEALVVIAEHSGARCGLENVLELIGFCVQKILAAQAVHRELVW